MDLMVDIVIVGCGVAGLNTALNLPVDKKIIIITKTKKEESNSFLAQGGISVLRNQEDFNTYLEDTMKAGHYENNKNAVKLMIENSQDVIKDLINIGVEFEKENNKLIYTKEGAHSIPRILYHKDITGKEITSKLLEEVEKRENITILEYTTMVDIISNLNSCYGIVCEKDNKFFKITSDFTVLATGGIGGLYEHSTNYPHIKGDSLGVALKHNIELKNINYIQIHPTSFYSKEKGRSFLISESVRGEGGILLNKNHERFVNELLPRDVVTIEIKKQMELDFTDYVWLSFENINKETIKNHFPNIYEHTKSKGYNILKEEIPVVPAQHYFMGGINVDLNSKTSMGRLYAVGETSCNGVHGANRLASNSLLESLVFSKIVGKHIINNYSEKDFDFDFDLEIYKSKENILNSYSENILEIINQQNM